MCNCENCMWAIWDYAGMHAVACMEDPVDDKCPTEEDVETAKRGGYLAYYGCSDEEHDVQSSEFRL